MQSRRQERSRKGCLTVGRRADSQQRRPVIERDIPRNRDGTDRSRQGYRLPKKYDV